MLEQLAINANAIATVQDYIVLFLWAVGTKATLDIVTSVLYRFLPVQSK